MTEWKDEQINRNEYGRSEVQERQRRAGGGRWDGVDVGLLWGDRNYC